MIKKISITFIILFVILLLLAPLSLLAWGKILSDELNQNQSDFLIVFTGGERRLDKAKEYVEKWPTTQVLISGVNLNLNLETIKKDLSWPANHENISIDHAQNTIENVLLSIQKINAQKNNAKVLILSNYYHLPRIYLIYKKLMPRDARIHYLGVESKFNYLSLASELFKLIKTYIVLFLWI